jgi:hydroxymethylbilane synthase
MADNIVLGTRGSALALAQARQVVNAMRSRWKQVTIETKAIPTLGDNRGGAQNVIENGAGRKGLFTGEIERALVGGQIDLAVHSAKDLPSELTPGTEIAAVLPRGPVNDVLVSPGQYNLQTLPGGGVVATGSIRRQYQLRWKRPDLDLVELRGNVPTRLRKLTKSVWHGIILAQAGLNRLGFQVGQFVFDGIRLTAEVLSQNVFLPAGGQGVIAIQVRSEDDRMKMMLESINDFETRLCLRAEREFLRLLHADCNQPVGVHAQVKGIAITTRAQVFDLETTTPREATVDGSSKDPEAVAAELLDRIHGR